MKRFISLVLILFSGASQAAVSTAFYTRTVYISTNVTTGAWVQLVASSPSQIAAVGIFNSCVNALELGVGSVGNEVAQISIFPGGGGSPISIAPNSRISVRAVGGNCSAANTELDINYFLN